MSRRAFLRHLKHARQVGNLEAVEIARWCLWVTKRGRFMYS